MSHLSNLASQRSENYRKDPREEQFLERMNQALAPLDQEEYQDYPLEHPFFFVIGLPRSGTTFTTQFLARAFGLSYVNNLAARFFQAPLQGLRLSEALLGDELRPSFQSNYAATSHLGDIHEFGYFWRHWLRKGKLDAMERIQEDEKQIDWSGLRRCLSSLQHHWGNASVFKNIFGSYHLPRLMEALDQQVMVVYIERDELDTAVSIYKAREKYYGRENIRKWWSYSPPEVGKLLDKNVYEQIAGQITYLKRFYQQELAQLPEQQVVYLDHAQLMNFPQEQVERITGQTYQALRYSLSPRSDLPGTFELRKHSSDAELREKLSEALKNAQKNIL